jgi:multidrug resistance efflux pump
VKKFIPVLIIIFALAGGYQWYTGQNAAVQKDSAAVDTLVGSGSIEGETIAITAELGGRIMDIGVREGDYVAAGQVLITLDQADLLAQQQQLQTAVALTKANLELVSAPPRPEDVTMAQAQVAQAETAGEGARLTWLQINSVLSNPHELEAKINQGQARIAQAESNLEQARVNLKRTEIKAEAAGRNQSSTIALAEADAAQKQFQAAQIGVNMAQVAVDGAKQQVAHLLRLRDQPLQLIAQANAAEATYQQTQAGVQAAQANLAVVLSGATPEDITIARAQVAEAETALRLIQVQLDKQTLTAPRAGLVSKRLVEPGELAAPGKKLLELSDIETVDLVVYIPETHIGQVKTGHPARVYVDAFPRDPFEGVVTYIAHQAEFTPRNVQTQEERVNLVFAVKITLNNADHRLKPGMPADAEILTGVEPQPARLVTVEPTKTRPAPTPTPTKITAAEPTATPAAGLEPTPAPTHHAEILAWALKVRRGPDLDQPAFSHLSQGEIVPVLAVDAPSGWLQVELPSGETGWITGSSTYVTTNK